MERLLIGIEDAAETLGVGRSTAYSLINTGDLETVKIGRRSLITAASVLDYVERLTSTDTRPAAAKPSSPVPAAAKSAAPLCCWPGERLTSPDTRPAA